VEVEPAAANVLNPVVELGFTPAAEADALTFTEAFTLADPFTFPDAFTFAEACREAEALDFFA
jgi:hypothetical protein